MATKKKPQSDTPSYVLDALTDVIKDRSAASSKSSYTAKLLEKGTLKIAQKVGEEAVETGLAAVGEGKAEVIAESADLLYHLLVLWHDRGIEPSEVWGELAGRFDISGLEEKARRGQS